MKKRIIVFMGQRSIENTPFLEPVRRLFPDADILNLQKQSLALEDDNSTQEQYVPPTLENLLSEELKKKTPLIISGGISKTGHYLFFKKLEKKGIYTQYIFMEFSTIAYMEDNIPKDKTEIKNAYILFEDNYKNICTYASNNLLRLYIDENADNEIIDFLSFTEYEAIDEIKKLRGGL